MSQVYLSGSLPQDAKIYEGFQSINGLSDNRADYNNIGFPNISGSLDFSDENYQKNIGPQLQPYFNQVVAYYWSRDAQGNFSDKLIRERGSFSATDEQQIFISESSVYRILKNRGLITSPAHIFISAGDEFTDKTKFVHQMWQTDFTYFKIIGWGWYYLSTVLDDYSRYIVHWELCSNMKSDDVKRTIDRAIVKAKLITKQRPKLLSDNGSCYIAKDLKEYLKESAGIDQIHGRPGHPQTQGKIERYHRTMKNVVKLDHYYAPEELEKALEKFVLRYIMSDIMNH